MYFDLQARHVILLLCQFINYMEVIWLPVYCPSQQEKDDPKLYAENIRRLMAREVGIFINFPGLVKLALFLCSKKL